MQLSTPEGVPFYAMSSSDSLSIEKVDYYEITEFDHLLELGHAGDLLGKLATQLGGLFGG